MKHMGNRDYQLWDEQDGFFYDVLRYPDGRFQQVPRPLAGRPDPAVRRRAAGGRTGSSRSRSSRGNFDWFLKQPPRPGRGRRPHGRARRRGDARPDDPQPGPAPADDCSGICDPDEFLSDYGIRSLSKAHEAHPFEFDGQTRRLRAGRSRSCKIKGGNSNWRGPIWFPTTFLLIESLRKLGKAFGPNFDSDDGLHRRGSRCTFPRWRRILADRLIRIFTRDGRDGRRPVYGGPEKFQDDPHWRDLILFYEYFHGDNGAGLGASHQTGWTALVASLIDEWRE